MKIGELFVLGFKGPTVPDWLIRFSEKHGLGGVILFDFDVQSRKYENNIRSREQLRDLCTALHALPSHPQILIDQEGGKVRRLKESLGFAPLPSAKELASMGRDVSEPLLRQAFREMKDLGIDVDLAPVIDLDLNPENPDIGAIARSPSRDRSVAYDYAQRMISIAEEVGLGLCLKHYPGLGGAQTNSHLELTRLDRPGDEQLSLFTEVAGDMVDPMVLISHAICADWDDEPVSVSQKCLRPLATACPTALLITDDIQMQGLQRKYSSEIAAERALRAGIDWILIGNNLLDEQLTMESIADRMKAKVAGDAELTTRAESALQKIARRKSSAI